MHTCNELLLAIKKKHEVLANAATWIKLWKHYVKWKKSHMKGCILWFHLHEKSRINKLIVTETDWWLPGVGKDGKLLLDGYRISFQGDENILELDSDYGYTTFWCTSVTELYTLK